MKSPLIPGVGGTRRDTRKRNPQGRLPPLAWRSAGPQRPRPPCEPRISKSPGGK